MSRFLTPLVVEILPPAKGMGRQVYRLKQDFMYRSALVGLVVCPEGMTTDFASIPRIAWRYLDPEDPCILFASLVHDLLYERGGKMENGRRYDRETADKVLIEAMSSSGARWDQKQAAYAAVRAFGAIHWQEAA